MTKLRKEITIVNMICTKRLNQKINIKSFNRFKFLECNLDIYRCGYVKASTMQGKVSVFESGNIISIGTTSYNHACNDIQIAVNLLKKYKLVKSISRTKPEIRNIVGKIDVKQTIPIEQLSQTIAGSRYEPETFPALIYKMITKVTVLIFATGKIIVTGVKTIETMNSVYFELKQKGVFQR